jgi:hypothetical protein
MSKNQTIILTGNTFAHKDEIKAIGGKWDADRKAWIVEPGTMRERANQSAVLHSLSKKGVKQSWA